MTADNKPEKKSKILDLVSVIIPVHNSEKYLTKCLESITKQTYNNLEILVILDNSTDKSLSITEDFQAKDSRIKIKEINKKSAALARKIGVESAKSEFICFVDSDDIIHERYVEILHKEMIKNNVDLSVCGLKTFNENSDLITNTEVKNISKILTNLPKEFCERYHASNDGYATFLQSMHCKMFKINLLKNIDYSMIYNNILEDNFIMIQVLKNIKSQKICLIDDPLYFYRIGQQSVMSNALYSQIKYKNETVNYVELFEKVGKFICDIYEDNKNIKKYVSGMELIEYRNALKSAIYDVNSGANQIKILEDANEFSKQKIDSLDKRIEEIINSKTFKVSQKLSKVYNITSFTKKP